LENLEITELMLDSVNIENLSIEPLLFQTGYLTVKKIRWTRGVAEYILKMPNYEVREAFNQHILSALTESDDLRVGQARKTILGALYEGAPDKMLAMLRSLFASIPYQLHVDLEAYYHSIFYAVMNILGLDLDVEVSVSKGRIDAVIELTDKIYVMEFKYKNCQPETSPINKQKLFEVALSEGMEQINEKGYHKKYIGSGKTIYLAAFAFLGRDDIEMKVAVFD
jgi:hypothetical protein